MGRAPWPCFMRGRPRVGIQVFPWCWFWGKRKLHLSSPRENWPWHLPHPASPRVLIVSLISESNPGISLRGKPWVIYSFWRPSYSLCSQKAKEGTTQQFALAAVTGSSWDGSPHLFPPASLSQCSVGPASVSTNSSSAWFHSGSCSAWLMACFEHLLQGEALTSPPPQQGRSQRRGKSLTEPPQMLWKIPAAPPWLCFRCPGTDNVTRHLRDRACCGHSSNSGRQNTLQILKYMYSQMY